MWQAKFLFNDKIWKDELCNFNSNRSEERRVGKATMHDYDTIHFI